MEQRPAGKHPGLPLCLGALGGARAGALQRANREDPAGHLFPWIGELCMGGSHARARASYD